MTLNLFELRLFKDEWFVNFYYVHGLMDILDAENSFTNYLRAKSQ